MNKDRTLDEIDKEYRLNYFKLYKIIRNRKYKAIS